MAKLAPWPFNNPRSSAMKHLINKDLPLYGLLITNYLVNMAILLNASLD
jgi:hypothetical protein